MTTLVQEANRIEDDGDKLVMVILDQSGDSRHTLGPQQRGRGGRSPSHVRADDQGAQVPGVVGDP